MTGEHDQNPRGLSLAELLLEDFRTHDGNPASPGFWAVALHRLGNARMRVRRPLRLPLSLGYRVAHTLVNWGWGIDLPYTVRLGRRVRIWHHGGIVVNARAVGDGCQIRHNVTLGVARTGDPSDAVPEVGDGVDFGVGCCVLGEVTVGDGARVGAGCVVIRDVLPDATVVGVPGRLVRDPDLEALRRLPVCIDCPIGGRNQVRGKVCPRTELCDQEMAAFCGDD